VQLFRGDGNQCFRRYLLRALALGAVRSYFKREENDGIRAVADLAALPIHIKAHNNQAEQDIIARELLDQVTGFPNLRPDVCATLLCIRALGPDEALKEHAFTASGDPDRWKGKEAEGRSLIRMRLPKRWGLIGVRFIVISVKQESSSAVPSMRTANCS